MTPAQRRGVAVAVSVALHGVVLGAVVVAVHRAKTAVTPVTSASRANAARWTQMRVRFEGHAAATAPVQPVESAAQGATASLPPAHALPKRRKVEPLIADARPASEPVAPRLADDSARTPALAGDESALEAGGTGGFRAATKAGGVGGSSQAGAGDALLAQLQAKLAEAARRCYPHEAERFRLQGHVPLAFCLSASGTPQATKLEGSTGSPILDRAAKDCVVPAAVPLPPRAGCYTVTVRFGGQG